MSSFTAEPRLEMSSITKTFRSDGHSHTVLAGVDLSIAEGEFVAVVGKSGSGKTTLLNIAAGLERADSGQVRVDGRPVEGPGPERGVVFQQYAVFPWLTVRQNIEFGLRLSQRRKSKKHVRLVADRYIELMGLTSFADSFPKTLSGGMKQRVAIARAYAVDPEILLMDEPFGALDAQTRDHMQELLLNILAQERRSVMFVTHSVEEAIFLANRVAILSSESNTLDQIVHVDIPHPRDPVIRTSGPFNELRRKIEIPLRDDPQVPDPQIPRDGNRRTSSSTS
jgi:NitT/TauT family transport system ATP-binding protein